MENRKGNGVLREKERERVFRVWCGVRKWGGDPESALCFDLCNYEFMRICCQETEKTCPKCTNHMFTIILFFAFSFQINFIIL